ncbi:MAG TPA: lysophospholipid acyltransferase family protein [Ktedonobacterales bacterium]|jgi:KDO2-lipid IV(A) lauroyltransferase
MIYWLLRSATWLVRWIPGKPRRVIGGLLCVAAYWCWPEKRRNTINNMAHILGRPASDRQVRQLARRSWGNYGRYLGDFFNFPNVTRPQLLSRLVDISPAAGGWVQIAKEGLARGKGIIIATAHFGNWDVAGALVASRISMAAIAETFPDPRVNALVQGQRAEKGIRVIPMEGVGARKVLQALKNNEAVAIVFDRPMTAKDGVPVTFFGSTTYVPGGVAALALKAGATIMPGFAWYAEEIPGSYYGKAGRPIIAEPVPGKTTAEQVVEITQQMCDALEAIIREAPDQWYMFRSFWPKEKTSR